MKCPECGGEMIELTDEWECLVCEHIISEPCRGSCTL